jgi:DNA-directed RNA polymerase subunit RPC12/RpoP
MGVKTMSAEVAGRRWVEGCTRAVTEALNHPTSKRQYDWGLSFAAGDIRTIIRKNSGQPIVTFSRRHLREGQLESVEKVRVVVLPEGGLAILPATREEIEARHHELTDAPMPTFPESQAPEWPERFQIICAECGQPFESQTPRRIFCSPCKHARVLAQMRERWMRKGKRTPSYLAKLKPRTVRENVALAVSA